MQKIELAMRALFALHVGMWKIIVPTVLASGLVALIWMPWWAAIGAAFVVEALICGSAYAALKFGEAD